MRVFAIARPERRFLLDGFVFRRTFRFLRARFLGCLLEIMRLTLFSVGRWLASVAGSFFRLCGLMPAGTAFFRVHVLRSVRLFLARFFRAERVWFEAPGPNFCRDDVRVLGAIVSPDGMPFLDAVACF